MTFLGRFLVSYGFQIGILLLGAALRLRHYFDNCSLWLDESWVAVEIAGRSILEIICTPPYNPPLGFSLAEKFSILLLGNHEYGLRIFSLLASLVSLILFFSLVRKCVEKAVVPIALIFFSTTAPFIYQSAQVKQYSSDVCMVLILYVLTERARAKDFSPQIMRLLGMVGAVALWISNSSIFVLAAIALTWIGKFGFQRDWKKLGRLSCSFVFWAWSFAALYFLSLKRVTHNQELLTMWVDAFAPASLFSVEGWRWFKNSLEAIFIDPGGFILPFIPQCFFLLGGIVFFLKDRERFFLFILPFLLVIAAAVFHTYPLKGRLLLFLLPGLMIFIARGISGLWKMYSNATGLRKSGTLGYFLAVAPAVCLLVSMLGPAVFSLGSGYCKYDSRAIMRYLKENYVAGDRFFFNSGALYPFWYYLSSLRFSDKIDKEMFVRDGKTFWSMRAGKFYDSLGMDESKPYLGFEYQQQFYDSDGYFQTAKPVTEVQKIYKDVPFDFGVDGRAWVVLLHIQPTIREFILQTLEQRGTRVLQFEKDGAYVYLYNLKID